MEVSVTGESVGPGSFEGVDNACGRTLPIGVGPDFDGVGTDGGVVLLVVRLVVVVVNLS